jgi:hypothetical protein
VRLAGYARRTEPVSTILDPIEISAVLLEGAGKRCLIFSCDLMIVGSELQQLIHANLAGHGFLPGEILLLASHTHFAPATDRACSPLGAPDEKFVSDVAKAAEGLLEQMLQQQPSEVRLEIKRGRLNHSVNRRRYWPFPTIGRTYGFKFRSVVLAPDPEGPTAELATILLVRRADGNAVLCAMWHYVCHGTAVIPHKVVSADYPGAVRRVLRQRFGHVPCVFVQGFCGDISPNISSTRTKGGVFDWVHRVARLMISGPTFPYRIAEDWKRWSESLATQVAAIADGVAVKTISPERLSVGAARIPLGEFFSGTAPDKPLAVQVLRLGEDFELVALSAEVTVQWQEILDRALPDETGRIRLYAGYLGALFGYLPTPAQIREGGYEVEGFQRLFGLSGKFDPDKIVPAVISCAKQAIQDL